MIAIPISIFSLLTISVDRYKTVSDPLSRLKNSQLVTPTRALIVIALIWLYCPLWLFRPFLLLFFRWWSHAFFTSSYIELLSRTIDPPKEAPFLRPEALQGWKKVYLRNVKAAKTTSMFVLALFFCWQPYFYFSLLVLSTPKTGNRFLTKFSWYYWCSIWSSWFEYRKATTLQIRIFPKHLYRSVR